MFTLFLFNMKCERFLLITHNIVTRVGYLCQSGPQFLLLYFLSLMPKKQRLHFGVCLTCSLENIIRVGQEFGSYEAASKAISEYQRTSGIQFYRRDARKIAANRVKRPIKQALEYYDLRYCCIHGGRKYSKTCPGKRESS